MTKRGCLLELRSRRRARVQGGRASLHPAERLLRCMGVNGALSRVLTRSVLACGCAPLRLARPPLTPTTREHGPNAESLFQMPPDQPCTQAACAGVAWLPCRLCTGSRQGRRPRQCRRQGICTRLPQRPHPLHGSDAMRWAVTARRSDGPAHAANNMGESQTLLRAAYMMMPALH